MSEKNIVEVLKGIADKIRDKNPEYENKEIAPNEFYNAVLSISSPTFAESMVDVEGGGFSIVKNLTINEKVDIIDQYAFDSSPIISVAFKEGVKTISKGAFQNCKNLITINWGSVTDVEVSAFSSCTSIEKIEVSEHITNIVGSAFYACSGLNEIRVNSNNPIYYGEGNCIITKNEPKILIRGCKTSSIPEDVTQIGQNSFSASKITNVIIPNNVTRIGEYAFMNCTELTSITLGSRVEVLEQAALYRCGCTELVFPASLRTIGTSAVSMPTCKTYDFSQCVENIPSVSADAFGTEPYNFTIIVPKGKLGDWKAFSNWANFAEIMIEKQD